MHPGDELPSEAELCELTGVSRVVVRSALSQLAGRSIVNISSGRRARVGSLDPGVLTTLVQHGLATSQITVAKVLEVRRGVEVGASRLAAERRTDEQSRELAELCRRMEAAIEDGDEFVDLDVQFHLKIAEASDNALYVYIVKPLREVIKQSIEHGRLRQTSKREIRQIIDHHWTIQRAIEAQDSEATVEAMRAHLDVAMKAISDV